jgi:glycosidase
VVDAATDFGFRAAAVDWLARRAIDAAAMRRRLLALELGRGGPAHAALRFLSTHDHPRFATLARLSGRGPSATALALLLLFTSPGVPALLYGEELGLSAATPALQIEDVWPDRMPMPWRWPKSSLGGALRPGSGDPALRALVQRLIAARKSSPALSRGELEIVHAEGQLLVYRRTAEAEVIDIVLHAGDEEVVVALEDEERPVLTPLVAVGEVAVLGQAAALGPGAGVALRRGAAP